MNNTTFTRIVEMIADIVIANRLDEMDVKKYVGGKGKITPAGNYKRGLVKQLSKSPANIAKLEKKKGKPINKLKDAEPRFRGGTRPNPNSNRSGKRDARAEVARERDADDARYEKQIKDTEDSLRGKL